MMITITEEALKGFLLGEIFTETPCKASDWDDYMSGKIDGFVLWVEYENLTHEEVKSLLKTKFNEIVSLQEIQ